MNITGSAYTPLANITYFVPQKFTAEFSLPDGDRYSFHFVSSANFPVHIPEAGDYIESIGTVSGGKIDELEYTAIFEGQYFVSPSCKDVLFLSFRSSLFLFFVLGYNILTRFGRRFEQHLDLARSVYGTPERRLGHILIALLRFRLLT